MFTQTAPDRANLLVTLTGGRMDRLDEVTVTILDETGKDHWGGGLSANVAQDEAAAFVWGPWEFLTAASVQIASNRQSTPRSYARPSGRNWDLLPLKRTSPGRWMSSYSQQQWDGDSRDSRSAF